MTGVSPHPADRVFAFAVRLLESPLDDPPDIRLQVFPSGSQTTALIPWLRFPNAPVVGDWNKTLARCCFRASEFSSLLLRLWCPVSPTSAGERVNRIL